MPLILSSHSFHSHSHHIFKPSQDNHILPVQPLHNPPLCCYNYTKTFLHIFHPNLEHHMHPLCRLFQLYIAVIAMLHSKFMYMVHKTELGGLCNFLKKFFQPHPTLLPFITLQHTHYLPPICCPHLYHCQLNSNILAGCTL